MDDYTEIKTIITKYISDVGIINKWFNLNTMNIYLRVTNRYLEGVKYRTIDIANINVFEEHRGQNNFKNLLTFIENEFPENVIFIENVFNKKFKEFFRKRNYKELDVNKIEYFDIPDSNKLPSSFYLLR